MWRGACEGTQAGHHVGLAPAGEARIWVGCGLSVGWRQRPAPPLKAPLGCRRKGSRKKRGSAPPKPQGEITHLCVYGQSTGPQGQRQCPGHSASLLCRRSQPHERIKKANGMCYLGSGQCMMASNDGHCPYRSHPQLCLPQNLQFRTLGPQGASVQRLRSWQSPVCIAGLQALADTGLGEHSWSHVQHGALG